MIIVTGLVELRPETLDEFIRESLPNIEGSRAEASCHGYGFFQDIENPCQFRVYEQWEDEAALLEHFQTPHSQAFAQVIRRLGVVSMDIHKYERGEVSQLLG